MFHEKAVPLLHASRKIIRGDVQHLIRAVQQFPVDALISGTPSGRLIRAGDGDDQPDLRVPPLQIQHGLLRQRVKSQRSSGKKGSLSLLKALLQRAGKSGVQQFPIVTGQIPVSRKADAFGGRTGEAFLSKTRLDLKGVFPEVQTGKAQESIFSTAINASLGTCTVPNWRMRFLPSFCFSSNFFFLVISPP